MTIFLSYYSELYIAIMHHVFFFFGEGMLKHNLGSVCLHTGQVVDPCTLITHEIIKEDILALGV